MSRRPTGWSNRLLNLALLGLGLVVLVLLYAFVTRSLLPRQEPEPLADPAEATVPGEVAADIIQVEVRNGCGISGLAGAMTQYLRDHGFDVVEAGDYSSYDQAETIVVDRVGNLPAALRVAEALGLPEDRVVQEIRQDYLLDASVIIGKDYATLPPFQEN